MNGLYEEFRLALHAVWSRRWIALAVAWGVCLLGWLVVALIPNSYTSEARIFIQTRSLLPGKIGISTSDQQAQIDRVRQTLTSAVNLEKVVRGTSLAETVSSDADVAGQISALQKQIKIVAQQENLFQISATIGAGGMSDAAAARRSSEVAQKLIDIFIDENLSGGRTQARQTLTFLDEQLGQLQNKLQTAEAKRSEFEAKYMGLLPGQGSIADNLAISRRDLSEAESQLVAAQSALSALNSQLASTPPTIAGAGGSAGPAAARLAAIRGQLADARAKGWTGAHPDVIALNSQLASAQAEATTEARTGGGSYGTPNPSYMSLRAMQADRQAAVAAASARKSQLAGEIDAMVSRQAANPEVAAEAAKVNRDYEVLKRQYDELRADREEVRIQSQAQNETEEGTFRVIDPPSKPRAPTAPNRPLLLFGVLIVGLGCGGAAAYGLGQLNSSFATAPRLSQATGMPVIGAVTEVVTEAGKALRMRQLRLFAGGAGALAGVFVLLVAVEFLQRGMVA